MRCRLIAPACLLALAAGCGDDPPAAPNPQVTALSARLEQLEKRLALVEPVVAASHALRADLNTLDQRVTGLAATRGSGAPAAASTPPAPPPPTAAAGAERGNPARDHRAELQALNDQFAEKRRAIRTEYGDTPSPERRAAMQEAVRWFRDQRRAVLQPE